MRGMLQTGIAARIRAQMAEWNLAGSQRANAEKALEAARHLDADEVGKRADRREAERQALLDSSEPHDAP